MYVQDACIVCLFWMMFVLQHEALEQMQGLLAHEQKVLEAIFPRHVIEYLTADTAGDAVRTNLHGGFWGAKGHSDIEKVGDGKYVCCKVHTCVVNLTRLLR